MPVGRLVALIAAVVVLTFGAAMWMNNVHRDVDEVKDDVGDLKEDVHDMKTDQKEWSARLDLRMERLENAIVRQPRSSGSSNGTTGSATP